MGRIKGILTTDEGETHEISLLSGSENEIRDIEDDFGGTVTLVDEQENFPVLEM